jgi:hypothetical protein
VIALVICSIAGLGGPKAAGPVTVMKVSVNITAPNQPNLQLLPTGTVSFDGIDHIKSDVNFDDQSPLANSGFAETQSNFGGPVPQEGKRNATQQRRVCKSTRLLFCWIFCFR